MAQPDRSESPDSPNGAGTVGAPSGTALAKASIIAFVLALVILVTVVLPAEYGVDPLGTGRALGLTDLFSAGTIAGPSIAPAAGGPLQSQPHGYRVDSRRITVASLSSIEFKYELPKDGTMVYSWTATAPVDFDFHTEPAGQSAAASETFERDQVAQKHGSYTAPYAGLHGWYWENLNDVDVTITVEAVGFFTGATLFPPNAPAQTIEIPSRRPAPAGSE